MRITVTVKPSSKKGSLVQPDLLGGYLVYVREPAQEGKANRAVTEILAKFFYYKVRPCKHVTLLNSHYVLL